MNEFGKIEFVSLLAMNEFAMGMVVMATDMRNSSLRTFFKEAIPKSFHS